MAPDRRFGLPHPFDADSSEESSPGKPGLWESFKRALGSPPGKSPASADTGGRPPAVPLPAAPTREPAPSSPNAVERSAPAPHAAGIAPEISPDVPFLDDPPFEPLTAPDVQALPAPSVAGAEASTPADASGPAADLAEAAVPLPEPSEPAPSTEPPARGPRLARGLASFSRDNARREKKFAHLLRDEPEAGEKRPGPPRRKR